MSTLVHQLAEFAQALTAAEDFDDTAEHLIVYAVHAIGADSGGITMLRGRGRLETFGATSPVVVDVDARRAFSVLSRFSQQSNVKLRDVSAELVRSRRVP